MMFNFFYETCECFNIWQLALLYIFAAFGILNVIWIIHKLVLFFRGVKP